AANIGRKFHTLGLKDFTSEDRENVVPIVEDYLENFENNFYLGIGITFSGKIGTGKTMAMNCCIKELLKRGISVYFIPFDDLIVAISGAWSGEEERWLEDKMKSVKVLGIDEWKTDLRNSN